VEPHYQRLLADLWGVLPIDDIASRLGRTSCAIAKRAIRNGLGSALPDVVSLRQLELETGYDRTRIRGAAARLNIRLKRAPHVSEWKPRSTSSKHRRVIVTQAQRELILAYLAKIPDGRKLWSNKTKRTSRDAWGTGGKPAACNGCQKTKNPHHAYGMCIRCYRPKRRQRCTQIGPRKK
jgi:hypothetical protein